MAKKVKDNQFLKEVTEVLRTFGVMNDQNQYIYTIPETGVVVGEWSGKDFIILLWDGSQYIPFDMLTDEVQFDILGYLTDNRHDLRNTGQNAVVEVGSVEDMSWVIPPQPVKSTAEGADELIIGSLAIAREVRIGEDELRSVLFISPDGTWTTITCYTSTEDSEKSVAQQDMKDIAAAITNFIDKL